MLTHAHSYAPKLQAPGQPSNEGRIYTALTLSLYSTESHGQGDTQLAGASGHHSALYAGLTAPLRGGRGGAALQSRLRHRGLPGEPRAHTVRPHTDQTTQASRSCAPDAWAPGASRAHPPALPRQLPNPTLNPASSAGHTVRWAAAGGTRASICLEGEPRACVPGREPVASGCGSSRGVRAPEAGCHTRSAPPAAP